MKRTLKLTLLFLAPSMTAVAQPYDYCIRGVNIINAEKSEPLASNKNVFIQGEKILRIADASESYPSDAKQVINGVGKYLLPGLVDMLVHLPTEDLDKFFLLHLDAGVTTIRSMRGKYAHLAIRDGIQSGEVPGPDLYLSSPYFPNKEVKAESIADTLSAYKAAGFNYVKILAVPDSVYYEALMTAARKSKMPVVGHHPGQVTDRASYRDGV